jgi:hypothetical protein
MEHPDSVRIPVGVVVERRRGSTPWAEWVWRAAAVLTEVPDAAPWTLLRDEGEAALFYAGAAEIVLFPTDTDNYRHNLQQATPLVWVVLRPDEGAPQGWRLQTATVDAGEAHLYADSGNDLLEALPLPAPLAAVLAEYVATHHRDRGFHKRRRDRADPESLAHRPRGVPEEWE